MTYILISIGIIILLSVILYFVNVGMNKSINKLNDVIAKKDVIINTLQQTLIVAKENFENLQKSQATLFTDINKVTNATTEEKKNEVVENSVSNFFNRKR